MFKKSRIKSWERGRFALLRATHSVSSITLQGSEATSPLARMRAGAPALPAGQSLAETAVSGIIVVLILLAFIDICVLLFAKSINDDLVQRCARAAAMMSNYTQAELVSKNIQQSITPNGIITSVIVEVTSYAPAGTSNPQTYQGQLPNSVALTTPQLGFVTVQSTMNIHFPAPVPLMGSDMSILNQAQLPITSYQAQF